MDHGGGTRLAWTAVPPSVRRRVESLVGASVVGSSSSTGGFSPGLASRLELVDGRRVFVKAASDSLASGSAELYRRELEVLLDLARHAPTARLIAHADDGGWVLLVYEYLDGRMPDPGEPDDLAAMVGVFDGLAADLDPSPLQIPRFEQRWSSQLDSWSRSAAESDAVHLDPWIAEHVARVAELAAGWRGASRGEALVHGDLRADNVILGPEGPVVLDWPEASLGAPWLDVVLAAPSMSLFRGAPAPDEIAARTRAFRAADPGGVTAVVAALAGFFLAASVEPVVPTMPRLRDFQRRQGLATARWLRVRLGEA